VERPQRSEDERPWRRWAASHDALGRRPFSCSRISSSRPHPACRPTTCAI